MKKERTFGGGLAAALIALLLAPTPAGAQEAATDAASQPDASVAAAPAPAHAEEESDHGEEDIQIGSIMPVGGRKAATYQFRLGYEVHANLISDERSGNDWLSNFWAAADLNVTEHDQLNLRLAMSQRYVVDPDESSFQADDGRFGYSRRFKFSVPISEATDTDLVVPGKLSGYVTIPGRSSSQWSIITEPTATLTLAPSVWRFTFITSGMFRGTLADYAESEGGASTRMLSSALTLTSLFSVTDWFSPSATWQSYWIKPHPTREGEGQPWRTYYYWELAANFALPVPDKWPGVDLTAAYAQGANVLEDGVSRFYFAKRDQTEIYGGLNVTY